MDLGRKDILVVESLDNHEKENKRKEKKELRVARDREGTEDEGKLKQAAGLDQQNPLSLWLFVSFVENEYFLDLILL